MFVTHEVLAWVGFRLVFSVLTPALRSLKFMSLSAGEGSFKYQGDAQRPTIACTISLWLLRGCLVLSLTNSQTELPCEAILLPDWERGKIKDKSDQINKRYNEPPFPWLVPSLKCPGNIQRLLPGLKSNKSGHHCFLFQCNWLNCSVHLISLCPCASLSPRITNNVTTRTWVQPLPVWSH